MANSKQQLPFAAIPKINAGRETNADTVITIISHKPKTASEWENLVRAKGDDSLRAKIWKASGAMEVIILHVQPLDRMSSSKSASRPASASSPSTPGSRPNSSQQQSSTDTHALEILAFTGHSFLNMEDCRRFRQHEVIQAWEKDNDADLIFQPTKLYYAHKTGGGAGISSTDGTNDAPSSGSAATATPAGLAVFDMDSTLIQQEVIDELARKVGRYEAVSAITEAAMRGEAPYTDFSASLRARVEQLRGVPVGVWEELKRERITFTPGGTELIKVLRARGWKTAVLSGGFTPLAEWVRETLGLDYAFANHLDVDDERGQLTGELVAGKPIVHGERKRELLLELAEKEGVPVSRTIAVGDGSNDLPMMHAAGLGIAFNAKPKVQFAAPAKVNSSTLLDVLYVLGFTKQELAASL